MLVPNILLITLLVSGVGADCSLYPSLSITAPKKMEALSGSCLQIPCSFTPKKEEEFNSSREIFGVWIKSEPKFGENPDNVIFNSSKTDNTYPMNITGNLRERNCTTLFSSLVTDYTNAYYFRIENRPFKATASCDSLQITVQDSPARPRIEVPADLKEKQSVTITCSAFTPCPHSPPQLTWSLQQVPHNMKENPEGTFTSQIQETITLSDHHDGSSISCSVTYPVNEGRDVKTAEETVTLSVSYAPKDTSVSISPSGLVSAGTWVTLNCSSRARPPVNNFTWFKISTDGVKTVAEGAVYSFNATDGGVYYCEALNGLGKERSPEKTLTVRGTESSSSSTWATAVGAITGITVVICVVVAIWWLKSKRQNSHKTQSLTAEEPAIPEPATGPEKEDIHYGVINFSMGRPKPSSTPSQNSGQQQETLYAEVNVSNATNSTTQPTAGHSDAIYAQVRKK